MYVYGLPGVRTAGQRGPQGALRLLHVGAAATVGGGPGSKAERRRLRERWRLRQLASQRLRGRR